MFTPLRLFRIALITLMATMAAVPLQRADAATAKPAAAHASSSVKLRLARGDLLLTMPRSNIVRVQYLPHGKVAARTLVMSPDAIAPHDVKVRSTLTDDRHDLRTAALSVVTDTAHGQITIYPAESSRPLLTLTGLAALASGRIDLAYRSGAPLYGIGGFNAFQKHADGLLRKGVQIAKAGKQGHAGAPLVWSTDGFAVLVDSKGARFDLEHSHMRIDKLSRPTIDLYLIAGNPKQIFAAVAELSGRAPLFPKWAMGFTNSQWGIDQKELLDIIHTYRAKHIPIDNFTLDFDWKAWGEDHYGEFRWNPKKFPDGASGKLTRMLLAEGMHLTGIMKPRIHVDTVEGHYATEHHLWRPGEKPSKDYFSHKLVDDIDFDLPAARHWFGRLSMQYAFNHGIAGWWNDEADETGDDTQFLNMQRSLYDAQRQQTDQRVWSINRNFWLGSQRYAYGLWSGDIDTGFASMAAQRQRMLGAIDVGAMLWGMDTGGFKGHPSPENYARWMQFAAFVPIFRVHGTFGEKRQPWVYGPVAERAATAAIRLRYRLIPYIYAYAWAYHAHGVGLVRPLTFGWPHDPKVRNDVSSWMFGDWLLVSPVVHKGQTEKSIYLPAGTWTDWFSGKAYRGGRTIRLAINAKTWSDIPLFVRQGAIIPTQPLMEFVGQKPVDTITLDVFPAHQKTHFDYYDDDGTTYAYEHGAYYLRTLSTQRRSHAVYMSISAVKGSYVPDLQSFLIRVHGIRADSVQNAGHAYANLKELARSSDAGWATGHDRFGPVTWIRVMASRTSRKLVLQDPARN